MKIPMKAGQQKRINLHQYADRIVCGAMLAGLLGCGGVANAVDTPASAPQKNKDIVLVNDVANAVMSVDDPEKVTIANTTILPEVSALGGALGDVALHLLRTNASSEQSAEQSNMMVSPFGVASVLGMLHAGASGNTADEIAAVLEPAVNKGHRLGERMKALTTALNENKAGLEITSAHRLWVDASLAKSISPAYAQMISTNYRADGMLAHFSDMSASVAAINKWSEQATHGKIKQIVTNSSLPASTKIVATSAVYMKAAWAEPFNTVATRKLPFYSKSGQQSSVLTMAGTMHVKQGSYKGLQIIEIPYANSDFVFYAAMPKNPAHTISALQQDANGLDIAAWPQMVSPIMAEVYLPKFTINPQPLALKEALQSVGMRTAFSNKAGFEGITGKADLTIDNVWHSAGIIVDEKGSEASAATAAVARLKSMPTLQPTQIHIDRPFLFVVMHKATTTPVFVGRVLMPKI